MNLTNNPEELVQMAVVGSAACIALPAASALAVAVGYFFNDRLARITLGLGAPLLLLLTGALMYAVLEKCWDTSSGKQNSSLASQYDQFLCRTVAGGLAGLLITVLVMHSPSFDLAAIGALGAFAVGSLVAGLGIELIKSSSASSQDVELRAMQPSSELNALT